MQIIPQYTHYLDSDEPVMLIDSHIGFDADFGTGIDGRAFAQELMWLDTLGKKRICIWINSPGGVVDDGFSIFNAILQTTTPVDTYNVGIAASTAGWLFEAGRTRYINDYAKIMIHNPFIDGDATSSDKKALREIKHSICVTLASRTGHTEEEIATLMDRETWINADEAIAGGFADEINDSADFNKAKKSIMATEIMSAWKEGARIFNSHGYIKIKGADVAPVINTKKQNSMSKILAKSLGLSEDATEEQILAAVTNLKKASKIVNDDTDGDGDCSMDDMKKRMDDIGKGIDDMKKHNDEFGVVFDGFQKSMDDMQTRMSAYETKVKADDVTYDSSKNEAAVELVNKYIVRIGSTDVKVINSWVKKAEADMTTTEQELKELPLNIKSLAKEAANGQVVATKNEVPKTGDVNVMAEWYARKLREKISYNG